MNVATAAQILGTESWPLLVQPTYPTIAVQTTAPGVIGSIFNAVGNIPRGCSCVDEPPVVVTPGRIHSLIDDDLEYVLGEYSIAWSSPSRGESTANGEHSSDAFLSISHLGTELWSSPPGRNFVGGASVHLEVAESHGSVKIHENVDRIYADQTVEVIELQPGESVTIFGRLGESLGVVPPPSGSTHPRYELSFRLCNHTAESLAFDLQIGEADHGDGADPPAVVNQAHLISSSTTNEAFYGFGNQLTHVNCKGYEIPVVAEEAGIGRGDGVPSFMHWIGATGGSFSSYAPSPHFITSTGRSLFLTNVEPSTFDLRADDWFSVRVQASRMTGCLLAGKEPLGAIRLLTEFVGRMPPLPEWVHRGAIVGMQGGTEKVGDVWRALRRHETPVAGVWLQDWVGLQKTVFGFAKQMWWNWSLDPEQYPGFAELVSDLDDAGIAVGAYISPYLSDVPESVLKGRRNLYREASERKFLVRKANGEIYTVMLTFPFAVVDLSNADARAWLKEVIKTEMLEIGMKFWMADYGEIAQFDGVFQSGQSGLNYHNQYPIDYAKLNREVIEESGLDGNAWFFMRSGFLDTPKYATSLWLGDQNVDWSENDGLPSAINGLLSGGFSGFSISHSDIGGYTSLSVKFLCCCADSFTCDGFVRSRELLYRWMEMNAFTAIFRTHEGNEPEKNVQFYTDEDSLATFARWSKVYAALAEYRIDLMEEAATKGYPIVRHPILHYPTDANFLNSENTFMLGRLIFVAPIVEPGVTKAQIYLPKGTWVHLWSGETFGGGTTVGVAAIIGQPPVFYVHNAEKVEAFAHRLKKEGVIN